VYKTKTNRRDLNTISSYRNAIVAVAVSVTATLSLMRNPTRQTVMENVRIKQDPKSAVSNEYILTVVVV
jgi:hypothetical protein